jgi:hypothetical protein
VPPGMGSELWLLGLAGRGTGRRGAGLGSRSDSPRPKPTIPRVPYQPRPYHDPLWAAFSGLSTENASANRMAPGFASVPAPHFVPAVPPAAESPGAWGSGPPAGVLRVGDGEAWLPHPLPSSRPSAEQTSRAASSAKPVRLTRPAGPAGSAGGTTARGWGQAGGPVGAARFRRHACRVRSGACGAGTFSQLMLRKSRPGFLRPPLLRPASPRRVGSAGDLRCGNAGNPEWWVSCGCCDWPGGAVRGKPPGAPAAELVPGPQFPRAPQQSGPAPRCVSGKQNQ